MDPTRRRLTPPPAAAEPAPKRVLLLGGTTEASQLAQALSARDDVEVVTSLAGRTANPARSAGLHRSGGFGGPGGLAAYLRAERIAAVVDATHPFAAVMRWHAHEACARVGVPRLRLERPGWQPRPGDRWTIVADLAQAAARVAAGRAGRVFLTTGRGGLEGFAGASDGRRWWLVRCIDPPAHLPLQPAELLLDRGPFTLESEMALLERHHIDLLVTKNSGGDATAAKLQAARRLGIEVLMVARPTSPAGPSARTVDGALAWIDAAFGSLPTC